MLEVFRKSPEQNLDDQAFQVLQVLWWGPKNYLERLGHGIPGKNHCYPMISNCYAAAFSAIFLFASVHLPSNVTLKLVAIAKSSCERQWSCCATGGLPAKRLARFRNYGKAAWPDGHTMHTFRAAHTRRKKAFRITPYITWGHSCSFWSRPFHSDLSDKSSAVCVPTSGLKRCCELVGLQFTPNMAVIFSIVVNLGHRMSTFIRLSQCPFLSKDSFFPLRLVEHSNWPVPAMSNAWRILPMSPPSDRRRRTRVGLDLEWFRYQSLEIWNTSWTGFAEDLMHDGGHTFANT